MDNESTTKPIYIMAIVVILILGFLLFIKIIMNLFSSSMG
jgi:hypothetical protein